MTDQEAQKEYDEALTIMEEVAESTDPGKMLAKAMSLTPRLMALTHYLLQEVKQLKFEVARLKIPRRTQY